MLLGSSRIPNDGRPPCIECGSEEIISNGLRWLCKVCRRQWNKVSREMPRKAPQSGEKFIPSTEVIDLT